RRRGLSPLRSSDLPGAVSQHGDALARGGDPGDVDLGRPDPEVDVDLAAVDAVAILVGNGPIEALAEGDVAGRVLVEECVVEDPVERADPPAGGARGEVP